MFLIEKKSSFPSLSLSSFRAAAGKRSAPVDFDFISKSFDEAMLRRLKPLGLSTESPPSISLSWLSLAVDFLFSTHAEAQALISKLTSGSSDDSKSIYLDYSVKLLDICNSISSEIERLRNRRLLMNFVLRLLQVNDETDLPAPEKLRKARDSIIDWEKNARDLPKRRGFGNRDPEIMIRDLAAAIENIEPRGKTSSVGKAVLRTIYAVGLVTVFVAGIAVSAPNGVPEIVKIRVPAEFLWADSVNSLQSSVFYGERKVELTEMNDVEARAGRLLVLINGVISGDNIEAKMLPLNNAVKELESATSILSEGLDRLNDSVNKMFRHVLSTRNDVLENFRVGPVEKQRK